MINSRNCRLIVTMCGVDPACLGGISTLTRTLSAELSCRSDIDFKYIVTASQGSSLQKLMCFTRGVAQARCRFSYGRGVVHIHMADNASVVRACALIHLAKFYGQVVVLHVHCDLSCIREESSSLMQNMIDWAIAHADHVIALGGYLNCLFDSLGYPIERVTILPNAVMCPESNPYTSGRRSVLFLGNVSEAKGVLDLLDALVLIDDKLSSDIVVDLCGKDHLGIVEEIERRGLAHRVYYRGVVKPDDEFFSHYALNVLPSHHEAMPFALIEASAHGVPTVATGVGSVPEIIDPGKSGWLVEPKDVDSLSTVLLNILGNPSIMLEVGDCAYGVVRERYSLSGYIQRLLEVYGEVGAC